MDRSSRWVWVPALRVLEQVGWPILIGSIALFVLFMLALLGVALCSVRRGPEARDVPGERRRWAFECHREVFLTLLRSGQASSVDLIQAIAIPVALATFAGILVGFGLAGDQP